MAPILTDEETRLLRALQEAARALTMADVRLDDVWAETGRTGWQHAKRDRNRVQAQIRTLRGIRRFVNDQIEVLAHIANGRAEQ